MGGGGATAPRAAATAERKQPSARPELIVEFCTAVLLAGRPPHSRGTIATAGHSHELLRPDGRWPAVEHNLNFAA